MSKSKNILEIRNVTKKSCDSRREWMWEKYFNENDSSIGECHIW